MVWLPDGENIFKTRLFVLAEYMNATDGQTDGRTDTTRRHRCIAQQNRTTVGPTEETRSSAVAERPRDASCH